MPKYLTAQGLEKLKKELRDLQTTGRREVAEQLKHAAGFGDLSENAAFDEAKRAQGFLEGRIIELSHIIFDAKAVDGPSNGKAQIGSTVVVEVEGKKESYQIVEPEEADIMEGKISHESPLGGLLIGKSKGDKFIFEINENKIAYEIIDVR